jgi:hypothetical protein
MQSSHEILKLPWHVGILIERDQWNDAGGKYGHRDRSTLEAA